MESAVLSKLDSDYQILTELHCTGDSRTYLARHLQLNRDVTITVVRATGDTSHLSRFAADVDVLKRCRHPNAVSVIEGRWLSDETYAIVRARVRGSTLDQLLSAIETLPAQRAAAALKQIAAALAWAKSNGVMHRNVSSDTVVFQQGSGRVLVSFDPSRIVSEDNRTIRALAALMTGSATPNIAEYTAMVAPGAPVDKPITTVVTSELPVQTLEHDEPIVAVKQGMSFNARVVAAAGVTGAVVLLAIAFVQRRSPDADVRGSGGEAAGDVALHAQRLDTALAAAPVRPPPKDVAPRMNALETSDREMNNVYQRLIAGLRRHARVPAGDPDPQTVEALRAAQRRWLQDRADACYGAGAGPFYARDHAACFAGRATTRARDLRQQLDDIP